MKTFWRILAAVLAAGAVYWTVIGNFERAFLFAAAGACAWILNYRAQLREKLDEIDKVDERISDDEEEDQL